MRKVKGILVFGWFAVLLTGCEGRHTDVPSENTVGHAALEVRLAALSVDAIAYLRLTVSGEHIDPDIVVDVPVGNSDEWTVDVPDIPSGVDRTFTAEAFDVTHTVIYRAEATRVTVLPGETVSVFLHLNLVEPSEPSVAGVPIVDALIVSPLNVVVGGTATLWVQAHQLFSSGTLDYWWYSDNGTFSDPRNPRTLWVAPDEPGTYTVNIGVSTSSHRTATATVAITVGLPPPGGASVAIDVNTPPYIVLIIPSPTRIDAGETTEISLIAFDHDPLYFEWRADDCTGFFDNPFEMSPSFTLDEVSGETCTLTVNLRDSKGAGRSIHLTIETGPPVVPEEVDCEGPLYFVDPNFEQVVRDEIGMPSGDIFAEDVAHLTNLESNGAEIEYLTGIQCLKNLTRVIITFNPLKDLSPLAELKQLTEVNVSYNGPVDLTPLAGLFNLTELNARSGDAGDLAWISHLTKLESLYLWAANITDIGPLRGLVNLRVLDLLGNGISDLSPLVDLVNLEYLQVGANNVSNFFPLLENEGLGQGDYVGILINPIDWCDPNVIAAIELLMERGANVNYEPCN